MSRFSVWRRQLQQAIQQKWLEAREQSPRIQREVLYPSDAQWFSPPGSRPVTKLDYPAAKAKGPTRRLQSCLCTQTQLVCPAFQHWIRRMRDTPRMHRKQWEHCFVSQALYERGVLSPGKRGLGFAVGQEPLPALFASFGCRIVATDLDAADQRSTVWANTGQHASGLCDLNVNHQCDSERFEQLVDLRSVDMNDIPDELTGFDFTWSSCSFEHCGSIELGQRFIQEQMKCLRPGGIAVHTTEFNLSSNDETLTQGTTVIFRKRDMEEIIRTLVGQGHHVEPLNLNPGRRKFDRYVDRPPYSSDRHLRIALIGYAATSIGLIIQKSTAEEEARKIAA